MALFGDVLNLRKGPVGRNRDITKPEVFFLFGWELRWEGVLGEQGEEILQ